MAQKNPKVIFKIDLLKEAKNYYDAANSDSKWGNDFTKAVNSRVVKKVRGKSWDKSKVFLTEILKKGYSEDKKENKAKLKEAENLWRKIEKRYFKKLEKITKHKIYTDEFSCYMTTIGRCPYNPRENWFMVNTFTKDDPCGTIAHELMHLQFHYYFEENLRKELSHDEFQDLKEALTVLLDIEFKDILKSKDKGYPSHKKLRDFISREWKKNRDFDSLIEKCVCFIKK